jgi:hypothetical protein
MPGLAPGLHALQHGRYSKRGWPGKPGHDGIN